MKTEIPIKTLHVRPARTAHGRSTSSIELQPRAGQRPHKGVADPLLRNLLTRPARHVRHVYCVGLGIKGLAHLTLEAVEIVRRAEVVFHLGLGNHKLGRLNPNARSLERLYWSGRADSEVYREVAEKIVSTAQSVGGPIVFAADGNPAVFNDITWEIWAKAKDRQIPVTIIPGISCLDVLPIILRCEIGDLGAQIFEANQLVLYDLPINPYLSTFVLQVGWFGDAMLKKKLRHSRLRFDRLISHLSKFYGPAHPAVFVTAATSVVGKDGVLQTTVSQIRAEAHRIHTAMTLYLPRLDREIQNFDFHRVLQGQRRRQRVGAPS